MGVDGWVWRNRRMNEHIGELKNKMMLGGCLGY